MLESNNILDDILMGMSHAEIAVKYSMSIEAVRSTVNEIFVQSTERYADLRQRISMLSVLRYEHLLGLVMPYAEGGTVRRVEEDGSYTEEPLPVDPRFVKLAVDIIKAENEIFDRERQIAMKTQDDESKGGMQNVEETILAGDTLYKAATEMMTDLGMEGSIYADMGAEDILTHSIEISDDDMKLLDRKQEQITKRTVQILPDDDELLELAKKRGIIAEDEEDD